MGKPGSDFQECVGLQSNYVPGFDGIRGLSIALVLFSHSVIYQEFTDFQSLGHAAGSAGVTLFFVLSGFLITTLLIREEDQTGKISLSSFYLRRAFRLFPALWLFLSVVFVFWAAGRLPHHPWHSFVTSLLYVRNFIGRGHETDHLWSLSIEEQFYILWPVVFLRLRQRNGLRLAIALSSLLAVTTWRSYASNMSLVSAGILYVRTDFRIDAPLYGCALALVRRVAPRPGEWLTSTGMRTSLLAGSAIAGLSVYILFEIGSRIGPGIDSTAICLFGVILVLSQVGNQGSVSHFITWKPIVFLGQISYGVYLWQQLFLGFPIPGLESIRSFPVGLAATVVVATLSFHLVERPLNRVRDRLRTRSGSGPDAPRVVRQFHVVRETG